jgi:hypothetical protein
MHDFRSDRLAQEGERTWPFLFGCNRRKYEGQQSASMMSVNKKGKRGVDEDETSQHRTDKGSSVFLREMVSNVQSGRKSPRHCLKTAAKYLRINKTKK